MKKEPKDITLIKSHYSICSNEFERVSNLMKKEPKDIALIKSHYSVCSNDCLWVYTERSLMV